jgi:Fe-S-cluster-containing hydrogenase component 2
MIQVRIEEQSCRGCKMCVDICPTEVFCFNEVKKTAQVDTEEDCIGCLSCSYLCPSGAITHSGHHVIKNFYRDLQFTERMEKFL